MIGVGIGIPFFRSFGGGIDAQAQAHFNRVIADGGVVPSGLTGVNAFFSAVKAIYGTSDINTAISAAYDPHYLGYRLGAGSGTTLGQAARTLYSCSGASADVVQTTAASQPLLLAHTGTNYYFNSIAVGNNITTPIKITSGYNGEYEIQAYIKPLAITASTSTIFTAGTNASLGLFLQNAGVNKRLCIWLNGGTGAATTNTIDVSTFNGWIKAYRTAVNVRFETSTDGINWTLFENVAIANTGYTLTGVTTIGNYNNSDASAQFAGNIYRVRVWINGSSSTGTLTYDFNPSSYNPATSQTQWTSATGEVWSINVGTATTGYKGVLVDRTIVQGDGVDDGLAPTSNILPFVNGTTYRSWRIFETTRSNTSIVSLGNNPNEIDNKNTNNTINNVAMFVPSLNLRFAAMQRNESALQGIANVNNGATITNTISALGTNLNRIYLFQNIFSQNGNGIVNTAIVTPLLDNATTRTAMYNAIRGFNNNAF